MFAGDRRPLRGDTETGAYTLLGGTATPSNGTTVTRNAGATIFLTSEDEWYKAAYYDPTSASYFDYPTGTNAPTTCAAPTATANTPTAGAVGELTVWAAIPLGEPLRHLRPGRQRLGVERSDHLQWGVSQQPRRELRQRRGQRRRVDPRDEVASERAWRRLPSRDDPPPGTGLLVIAGGRRTIS